MEECCDPERTTTAKTYGIDSYEKPLRFDTFTRQQKSSLIEETHYYPFGLTMAGISDKALAFGSPENKYKYNGIEKESDLGLEVYDAQLRELDGQIGRWWQVDPETESMEMWSPYTSNYDNPILYSDPLGDEGEVCCQWLVDAVNWVQDKSKKVVEYSFGFTTGTAVSVYDNVTGSNVRAELAPSYQGSGAAGQGWNTGLNTGDIGSVLIGGAETIIGGGLVGGSSVATVSSGGATSPVTVPVALAGTGMIAHGLTTGYNGINNLINQNGRVDASSSSSKGKSNQTGSYTNTHESGKTYSGKGSQQRAETSAKQKSVQNRDPVKRADWTPSKSNREAFKAEAKRIEKNGGANNPSKNYNKINSPGKKYLEEDKKRN